MNKRRQENQFNNDLHHLLLTLLRESGTLGFTTQARNAPGSPDIAFPKAKLALFIYDCEIHQCPFCIQENRVTKLSQIKSEEERTLTETTLAEDEKTENDFAQSEWGLMVVWSCQLNQDPLRVLNSIRGYLVLPHIGELEKSFRIR